MTNSWLISICFVLYIFGMVLYCFLTDRIKWTDMILWPFYTLLFIIWVAVDTVLSMGSYLKEIVQDFFKKIITSEKPPA